MTTPALEVAPVLSTPDTHIFEEPTPPINVQTLPRLSDEQLAVIYEIERTVREIRAGRWRRIALQFPDHLLIDGPRVFEALSRGFKNAHSDNQSQPCREESTNQETVENITSALDGTDIAEQEVPQEKLYILADTSYGACCVDEIAAEHADADVVVHYGRSCLSPTARLPVIYVFTSMPLEIELVLEAFRNIYADKTSKIILMADIPYSTYIPEIHQRLEQDGYINIFATSVLHDPSSPLPNRTVPENLGGGEGLREYQLFHISSPPPSLLLTLSSRVDAVHIFPTDESLSSPKAILTSSAMTLRRRYALLTSLNTVSIFGILINTLSVKNYLHIVEHVKAQIAAAGKKSYTFVVGKINAAKVANFSEVGGWVVIGCWESSLIESKDFWKPLITPFELELALRGDAQRVWTGEWSSDFQAILKSKEQADGGSYDQNGHGEADGTVEAESDDLDTDDEEESAPPEFDLRTGRYVSHTRPMRPSKATSQPPNGKRDEANTTSDALIKRANGDLARVGGVVSPGAEFLQSKRTWRGLGSDFEISYEDTGGVAGAVMEEGRSGIARGYVIPTSTLLALYNTSKHLRTFLQNYPLAWKNLSFRLPQPAQPAGTPGNETPDSRDRLSKAYSLDALLIFVVVPFATRLKSLDLCNTAVSGVALTSRVLQPRISTIQHLSVRGCKNVSIKYHIVPFLEPYTLPQGPWGSSKELALKSLYTYRCRHHRRRPYLPSSLVRRDSDSEPTHQLIEICHKLGIWTDTAWCPSPGPRCFRRKDYYSGRAAPGTAEVWVPFDRLWRSGNRIGPTDETPGGGRSDGRLWEDEESGFDGEALGTSTFRGQGKDLPAHERRSHKLFTENITCTDCGDEILERCEQCSVRMHCMGCRKTLCASCAFNRPIPRKRVKTRNFASIAFGTGSAGITLFGGLSSQTQSSNNRQNQAPKKDRFWWAPGATRSPNLMNESSNPSDGNDSDDSDTDIANANPVGANVLPPKLNMHWCCLEPIFSGGGGIAFMGPGLGGDGADRIRAAPLPRGKYDDPAFTSLLRSAEAVRGVHELKNADLYEHVLGQDVDILPELQKDSLDLQTSTCPRNLCQDCYRSFRWKVSCKACKKPLCKEHDFRGLRIRKCGYRDLHVEREYVLSHPSKPVDDHQIQIPAFRPLQSTPEPSISNHEQDYDPQEGPSSNMHLNPSSSNHDSASQTSADTDVHSFLNPPADMSSSVSSLQPPPAPFGALPVRKRAVSLSGLRPRSTFSSSWPNSPSLAAQDRRQELLPLPGNPGHPVQWKGCGSYFCQQFRPVGDTRPRCDLRGNDCAACKVFVCDITRCPCTPCTQVFHCPSCLAKPEVQALCRYEEERLKKIAKEEQERRVRERETQALLRSDRSIELVGEFLGALYGGFSEEMEEEEEEVDEEDGDGEADGDEEEDGEALLQQVIWVDGPVYDPLD
ncbi:diphthamide biosynthesis protein [Patellaria atrata CBS 101060]|uniref:S-adenosyl-L-methionine:L-histidine 3-amino-3-carboxypropyltransferase 2 n=1 Tax=Patellaria atrata CBS 101060 TaxID=1346257 RepID=A0A9P4S7G7_9PEZI|nr:diphthamide biosynthesis protein [Patellaria atrata CBS 101060]